MKKLFFSVATLALIAGSALAADLPSRKAPVLSPPPPSPPMWTGLYAGLNAGYAFGTNSSTQSLGPIQPSYIGDLAFLNTVQVFANTGISQALSAFGQQNQNGFIGGGQLGYNYQWGPNFLIGIEADMQGAGIRGGSHGGGTGVGETVYTGVFIFPILNNFSAVGGTSINAGVDWLGTVRGRFGYLWNPALLVYATGGLTYGGVQANVSNHAVETNNAVFFGVPFTDTKTYFGGGTRSQTLVGWNVGGGIEWMFMPNWSLKAEGLYWNMGNANVPTASYGVAPRGGSGLGWFTDPGVVLGGTRVNYQGVIARFGVNYHFNWGAAQSITNY